MRYPYVLFDIGETLVGPKESYGSVYSRVLARLGCPVPAPELESHMRKSQAELTRDIPVGTDRFRHFAGGELEYWRRIVAATLGHVDPRYQDDAFVDEALAGLRDAFSDSESWTVYPDVLPVLQTLRERGFRLGVVSNWDSRLPILLQQLRLDVYFEAIGVSHIEGLEKPSPEFFTRILDRLGGSTGRALHVGNLPEADLNGARSAGIEGILVDRGGGIDARFRPLSDLHSLPEIARDGLSERGQA